jgi:DHA1 family bicyclomycin/chloramphenicol resistance-like MFS transporter
VPPHHHRIHHRRFAFLLAALSTLGPFSVDTYLPSFPAIALHLAATPLQVQQTLSVYLFCFALMMLWHGALSDALGRRPVILAGLGVFALASIGCALAGSIHTLLLFRALQGLSAGAGIVVGRAMIRDVFSGHEAQQLMSRVTMIFAVAPAVAPVIGGWLETGFGWRSVFYFLTLFTVLLLLVSWRFLPETLPLTGRQSMHPRPLAHSYWKVLRHTDFLLLSTVVACNFSGMFLYVAGAPSFLIGTLHLAENQFGWLFIPLVVGMMSGAYLSGRMARRLNPERTINLAFGLMFVAALVNAAYNLLAPPVLPWVVLPQLCYAMGMVLAASSVTLLVLDLFPQNRGMAASLQAFVQTLLNAIVAGLVAPFLAHSATWLALGMAGFFLAGWLAWRCYLACKRHASEPGKM